MHDTSEKGEWACWNRGEKLPSALWHLEIVPTWYNVTYYIAEWFMDNWALYGVMMPLETVRVKDLGCLPSKWSDNRCVMQKVQDSSLESLRQKSLESFKNWVANRSTGLTTMIRKHGTEAWKRKERSQSSSRSINRVSLGWICSNRILDGRLEPLMIRKHAKETRKKEEKPIKLSFDQSCQVGLNLIESNPRRMNQWQSINQAINDEKGWAMFKRERPEKDRRKANGNAIVTHWCQFFVEWIFWNRWNRWNQWTTDQTHNPQRTGKIQRRILQYRYLLP